MSCKSAIARMSDQKLDLTYRRLRGRYPPERLSREEREEALAELLKGLAMTLNEEMEVVPVDPGFLEKIPAPTPNPRLNGAEILRAYHAARERGVIPQEVSEQDFLSEPCRHLSVEEVEELAREGRPTMNMHQPESAAPAPKKRGRKPRIVLTGTEKLIPGDPEKNAVREGTIQGEIIDAAVEAETVDEAVALGVKALQNLKKEVRARLWKEDPEEYVRDWLRWLVAEDYLRVQS